MLNKWFIVALIFCLATIFITLTFPLPTSSQSKENLISEIEISACQITLTDAGRQSNFSYNYIYQVLSDKNGFVKDVKEISDKKLSPKLLENEKFIPCIEKWKLKPLEEYFITIDVESPDDKYLYISSKTDKIKINL